VKAGDRVALFTRSGHDCARRLPLLVEAFAALPADTCIIDGELIADEGDRIGNAFSINRAIGEGRHHHIGVVRPSRPFADRPQATARQSRVPCCDSEPKLRGAAS